MSSLPGKSNAPDSPKLIVYEDNQATIAVLEKGQSRVVQHMQRTHRVNLAWLNEVVQLPFVELHYVKSSTQLADIFTKAFLNPVTWSSLLALLSLVPRALSSARRGRTLAIRAVHGFLPRASEATVRTAAGGDLLPDRMPKESSHDAEHSSHFTFAVGKPPPINKTKTHVIELEKPPQGSEGLRALQLRELAGPRGHQLRDRLVLRLPLWSHYAGGPKSDDKPAKQFRNPATVDTPAPPWPAHVPHHVAEGEAGQLLP